MIGGRPFFQPRRHMSELDLPLPANHGFLHVWGFKLKTPVIDCRAVRIPTNQCRQRADRDFVPSSSQYENDSVGGFRGMAEGGEFESRDSNWRRQVSPVGHRTQSWLPSLWAGIAIVPSGELCSWRVPTRFSTVSLTVFSEIMKPRQF